MQYSSEDPSVVATQRYISDPPDADSRLKSVAYCLDVPILATMSSGITAYVLSKMEEGQMELELYRNGPTVPVAECLDELVEGTRGVTRRDFCCLLRQEKLVLLWSRSVEDIMFHASEVESKLIGSVSCPSYRINW